MPQESQRTQQRDAVRGRSGHRSAPGSRVAERALRLAPQLDSLAARPGADCLMGRLSGTVTEKLRELRPHSLKSYLISFLF